jgi:hypothetical protein
METPIPKETNHQEVVRKETPNKSSNSDTNLPRNSSLPPARDRKSPSPDKVQTSEKKKTSALTKSASSILL